MQSDNAPQLSESKKSLTALVVVVPALILFAWDLFGHAGDLSPGVALRLAGGQLLQSGLTPYVDFWDWNQPLAYWLGSLPFALNSALEGIPYYVPPEFTFKVGFFCTVLFSLLLSLKILTGAISQLHIDDPLRRQAEGLIIPVVLGYIIALLSSRFECGVLQQVFMLASIPWVILRWLSYSGCSLKPWLGALAGLFLGLTSILDLPFPVIVAVLEIFFIAVSGRLKLDLAAVTVCGVCLSDLIYLHLLPLTEHKAFWQWTMPIRARQYVRFDASISAYVASPDHRTTLYLMAVAIVAALLLHKKQDFLRVLVAVSACGLALYAAEGDGLASSLVITTWAVSFIAAICLWHPRVVATLESLAAMAKLRAPLIVLSLAVAVLPAAGIFFLNKAREDVRGLPVKFKDAGRTDIFDVVNTSSVTGDSVIVLCDYPMPAYPLLFSLDRRAGSYLLWSRPLRVLNAMEHFNVMTPPLSEFEKFVYNRLEMDIRHRTSPIILVAKNSISGIVQNGPLKAALDAGYKLDGQCFYCSVNRAPAEYCGYDQEFDIYRRLP